MPVWDPRGLVSAMHAAFWLGSKQNSGRKISWQMDGTAWAPSVRKIIPVVKCEHRGSIGFIKGLGKLGDVALGFGVGGGLGSTGLMLGLGDFRGLYQPKGSSDS